MKYVLKLAYQGGAFHGSQRQSSQKTVQGEVERALSKIFAQPIQVSTAGRTDSGVHALGQIACFESETVRPLRGIVHGVNSMVGSDLRVLKACLLPSDDRFHPRFHALSRTYHYHLLSDCEPESYLFWRQRAWCVEGTLDRERLEAAAHVFLGTHDFGAFTSRSDAPHHIRSVHAIDCQRLQSSQWIAGSLWKITVTANGFLRKMVRLIAAAIVRSARGQITVAELTKILADKNPGSAPPPAPVQGLYLAKVEYEEDPFSPNGSALEIYRYP